MEEKITHDLVQGTPEWDAFRLEHDGASEAAAMLGLSKKVTRPQLLQAKKTGIAREFSDWLQANVLDYGHEVEAQARPLVEQNIVGDELYPVTCSRGRMSASCDGITLDDRIAFEHKQWNEGLAAMVSAGVVPDEHMPQCQQIMLVTGAEKVVFVVSDGTAERMVHTEVLADQAWFDRLTRGWAQFNADKAEYVAPAAAAPSPTGRAPESLPALLVQVTGAVTASNLAEFKEIALTAIRSVNRELTTDQHFADAAKAVKWCGDVEERIDAAKEHALSQTASIDALFKVMDDIKAEARQTRLDLEKLVKARNVALKAEIVTAAQQALAKHLQSLNERLGRPYMPPVTADFAGAIHGKKSFDSMRAALDATLANAKIAANEVADRIDANLKYLRDNAEEFKGLFADAATIVLKAPDDLQSLVKSRIADHKADIERQAQKQRDDMAAQEIAGIRQQAFIAVTGRLGVRKGGTIECIRETLAETEAWPVDETRFGGLTAQAQATKDGVVAEIKRLLAEREAKDAAATAVPEPVAAAVPAPSEMLASPAPVANVLPMPSRSPAAPASPPTMTLGQINERLGCGKWSEADLTALGFAPAATRQNTRLYHDASFTAICDSIVARVRMAQQQALAA